MDLVDLGVGMSRSKGSRGTLTISWVTCFGLKPSAAVADRGSDGEEPACRRVSSEPDAQRETRGDLKWPI